jgi:transcriptional regulator with XRE-family HTH domain
MSFRDNLREAIGYCGIEQKELANKAGISIRSLESYLREKSSIPSADKAVKIAQVLGVTVEYLVNGDRSSKKTSPFTEIEIKHLIQTIKDIPGNNQRVVIKIATYIAEIFKKGVSDISFLGKGVMKTR